MGDGVFNAWQAWEHPSEREAYPIVGIDEHEVGVRK